MTFPTPFATPPDCEVIESWTAETVPRMICGSCYDVTATGCKVQVMMSQGTLLVGASPFAKAGAGIKPIVRAIGR